jgi:hypothetical protein
MLLNDSDMTANNTKMTWMNGTVPLAHPTASRHAQTKPNVLSDYLEVKTPSRS